MRFIFSVLPDAAEPMPPFVRVPFAADEVTVEAQPADALSTVWAAAADGLGYGVGFDLDEPVEDVVAFIRFAASLGDRHDAGAQLRADDLEIVEADGSVSFARKLRDTTVADLERTAEAGLIPGDITRPYFIPQVPGGALEWYVPWSVFVGGYVMVRGVLGALADLEGAAAFVERLRRGSDALVTHAPKVEQRHARPDALYGLLEARPWATADLAERLVCPEETAQALLELFGFERDAVGLWRRGESEDARMLRMVLDEVITTGGNIPSSGGGSFEERVRHLLVKRERAEMPSHMNEYAPLEPGEVRVREEPFEFEDDGGDLPVDVLLPLEHMLLRCACSDPACSVTVAFGQVDDAGFVRLTFSSDTDHFSMTPQTLMLVGMQLDDGD